MTASHFTPTTSLRCGVCHGSPSDCPRILWCGEGGAADHRVPASHTVEYVIDLSGRHDYDNGDVEFRSLYVCGHGACVGSAENHASDVGRIVDVRELTAADIADATGYALVSA